MRVTLVKDGNSDFDNVTVKFTTVEELGNMLDELDFAVEHINHSPDLTELRDKLKHEHDKYVL